MDAVLGHGAEARIILNHTSVTKVRYQKSYRHPILDLALRKFRTKREAKVLESLTRAGVPCPQILALDPLKGTLSMSLVKGPKLRDTLGSQPAVWGTIMGELIGTIHAAGVIHGDLTTSNFIADSATHLTVIDFGLSFYSTTAEDRAVDLHVLEQILEGTHTALKATVGEQVIIGYKKTAPAAAATLARLDMVRRRGRNKVY